MTEAKDFCLEAARLVSSDRAKQHGDKRQNHDNIAALWNAWLTIRREPGAVLSARDVTVMMALLKIARMETGSINSDDYVDSLGYLALAGELSAE